ncbi:ferredoxin [Amycolatopsis methanolica]
MVVRLHIDWTACDGRGLCTELLPELLDRDPWGYPVPPGREPEVPPGLVPHAGRATRLCAGAAPDRSAMVRRQRRALARRTQECATGSGLRDRRAGREPSRSTVRVPNRRWL